MALVDLKSDLSKFKRDSFTSDIENKSKGIASGLNLDFASMRQLEDKFKEGVPQPNLDFGGSLDKPTPTVPTSMPGTPDKLTQPPRSFDATLDKPTPTVPTSFAGTPDKPSIVPRSFTGTLEKPVPTVPTSYAATPDKPSIVPRSFDATLDKPTPTIPTSFVGTPDKPSIVPRSFDATLDKPVPVIPSNWMVFAELADKVSMFGELPKASDPLQKLVSGTRGTLDFVNYFSDIHATGFTGNRLFGDVRFPKGSEFIGIGSYENPGRLWFGTTPRGQLHPMWEKDFPILDSHPHDKGISNPYYSSRDKLYGALEGWSDTQGTYFNYFKRSQSELDLGRRGTLKSAWDHGSVKLSIDDTGVSTIETNQYTKYTKTYLFPKGLLGDFTSFPDIPSKLDAYPPSILTFPRGGPVLTVKRGLKDIERHAKWFLSTKGIIWGLTQVGLQLLNTRPETRIWNPLSLGSIIPTIHISRHLQAKNLGINVHLFGAKETTAGGTTYTEAEDYKGSDSRLIQFLDTYVNTGGASIVSTKVLGKEIPSEQGLKERTFGIKRQTIGQLIYLVPGRGGIFGQVPGPDVRSQYHKTGEPIHQSPLEPQLPHAHLGRYKTLAYGRLEALVESDQRRGTSNQFKWEGGIESEPWYPIGKRKDSEYGKYGFKKGKDGVAEVVEVEAKKDLRLEQRYKLGNPGKPGLERLRHTHGVNASSGDKLDTVDLLNAQGYITSKNVKGGSKTADGVDLPLTELLPTLKEYPDLIPLHFYDVNNKAWILFRAYVGKFNDTISPNWGSTEIAGRPVPHYYYQKTERKISFDFKVVAMSKHELAPMWQKLNHLVGLCYPSFTAGAYPTMVNPFIKLTLGDVFSHVPGFLTTLTVSPLDSMPWELIRDNKRGLARVPMGVTVSTDFTYVGDNMPSQTSTNHYLQAAHEQSWVDHKSTFWGKPALGISYPAVLKTKDTGNK